MDLLATKLHSKWELNMYLAAMFKQKERLEMKLVGRNFLIENVKNADKFFPCDETV